MNGVTSYTLWPFFDLACSEPQVPPAWTGPEYVNTCVNAVRAPSAAIDLEYAEYLVNDGTPFPDRQVELGPSMNSYSFLAYQDKQLCIYDGWGCEGPWYTAYTGPICAEPYYQNKFSFKIIDVDDPNQSCAVAGYPDVDKEASSAVWDGGLQVALENIDNPKLMAAYDTPEWKASWMPSGEEVVEEYNPEANNQPAEAQVQADIENIKDQMQHIEVAEDLGVPAGVIENQKEALMDQIQQAQVYQEEIAEKQEHQEEYLEKIEENYDDQSAPNNIAYQNSDAQPLADAIDNAQEQLQKDQEKQAAQAEILENLEDQLTN